VETACFASLGILLPKWEHQMVGITKPWRAFVAFLLVSLAVWCWLQLGSLSGRSKETAESPTLKRISGSYSYGPNECDDPAMIVQISDFRIDFHDDMEVQDIEFQQIAYKGLVRPGLEPAPAYVGLWQTSDEKVRTTILAVLSETNLQRIELPPSPSEDRRVLAYAEYGFDALDKWATIDDWAPTLEVGYALFPCD
jgi:hypothetical protein